MEQIPLIETAIIECLPEHEPRQTIFYIVAAYRRAGSRSGYWKIHRETNEDEFNTVEAARDRAQRLASQWTHRRIIEVKL